MGIGKDYSFFRLRSRSSFCMLLSFLHYSSSCSFSLSFFSFSYAFVSAAKSHEEDLVIFFDLNFLFIWRYLPSRIAFFARFANCKNYEGIVWNGYLEGWESFGLCCLWRRNTYNNRDLGLPIQRIAQHPCKLRVPKRYVCPVPVLEGGDAVAKCRETSVDRGQLLDPDELLMRADIWRDFELLRTG